MSHGRRVLFTGAVLSAIASCLLNEKFSDFSVPLVPRSLRSFNAVTGTEARYIC